MFSIEAAKQQYVYVSKLQIEAAVARRVRHAENPIWGGFLSGINETWQSISKVPRAFLAYLSGSAGDPATVPETPVPESVSATLFGENVKKARDISIKAAEKKAESWAQFFSGNFTRSFSLSRTADHESAHEEKTILVDDKSSWLTMAALTAGYVGFRLALPTLIGSASETDDKLGGLSPSGPAAKPPIPSEIAPK